MITYNLREKNKVDDHRLSPIELLEISVLKCLLTYLTDELKRKIEQINIIISANKLRINVFADDDVYQPFVHSIKTCYILNHLNFKKYLIINRRKYEL